VNRSRIRNRKRSQASVRQKLCEDLDTVFSDVIIKVDNGICVTCGSTYLPTCSHVFGRSHHNTRWSFDNAFCQCWTCNEAHNSDRMSLDAWYIRNFGLEAFERLRARAMIAVKHSDAELQEMLNKFRGMLKGESLDEILESRMAA
jgi:hypothetical protein